VVPVGSSSLIFIEVRVSSAARSTGNPGFVCAALNKNWSTFSASVGAVPTVTWTPQISGSYGELVA